MTTARQMLGAIPVRRFADGGEASSGSGFSEPQQLYYDYLVNTPGQGTPEEIAQYVSLLNDYQSLASLGSMQGVGAPTNQFAKGALDVLVPHYGISDPVHLGEGLYYQGGALTSTPLVAAAPAAAPVASSPVSSVGALPALAGTSATSSLVNVVPEWLPGASTARQHAIETGNEAAWLQQVKEAADRWMANPGTAAEAYDGMIQAGAGVQDLLDAGVSQATISRALSIPTPEEQKQVNALALSSMTTALMKNPNVAGEIQPEELTAFYTQARDVAQKLMADGITEEERRYLQMVASQQGWGFADIRAAGVDPSILFAPPRPRLPPPPPPPPAVPFPQAPPTYPGIYQPGQPALDEDFRNSPPRTAIPGMPGHYNYTPAAKLTPATGSGLSWTPPMVTSRPRSLLSPEEIKNYGGLTSTSQLYAQDVQAQDRALLQAFAASGLPQTTSNYYQWRNRLRSGEFGAGKQFDPAAFQSTFGSWATLQPTALPVAPESFVQTTAPGEYTVRPIDLRGGIFGEG